MTIILCNWKLEWWK